MCSLFFEFLSVSDLKLFVDIVFASVIVLWNSPIVQRYPAASPHVPQEAANANPPENQNHQASPAYPNDFRQQFLNALDQIHSKTRHLSTLREIQSDTDQMVELLTDGHGFGPHPSAAGSSKRQRLGEDEKKGGDRETEKQQKKEEGNDNEAEKNERGDNEEVEKLQD